MRKPKDKHGYDLREGDMLYAHGYPGSPCAIIHSIDWDKKIVRLVERHIMFRYGYQTHSTIEVIASNTWVINFRSINRSYWRRWQRSKDAGIVGEQLRASKPYEYRRTERKS